MADAFSYEPTTSPDVLFHSWSLPVLQDRAILKNLNYTRNGTILMIRASGQCANNIDRETCVSSGPRARGDVLGSADTRFDIFRGSAPVLHVWCPSPKYEIFKRKVQTSKNHTACFGAKTYTKTQRIMIKKSHKLTNDKFVS